MVNPYLTMFMLKRHIAGSLVVASLALFGAGCGGTTATPSATTKTPPSKAAATDNCRNPYYPFKKGLTIAYRVSPTTGAAGSEDYTIETVDVSGTTAALKVEMAGGVTANMTADCANGSVALQGSSGLNAAVEGTKFKTTVVSSSGTTMPADVKAGSAWDHEETINMKFTEGAAASMGAITMTTKEQSKAIGEESITIPAGTYKALKVEVKRTITSVAKFGVIPGSTMTSTEWWVKGIGMVKNVTVTKEGTTTTEAKSISGA